MSSQFPQNYNITLPLNNRSIVIEEDENYTDIPNFTVIPLIGIKRILIQDNVSFYDN
jgi:hypothetical protein